MFLPELLMPAGDLSKFRTAIAYGADAVYVGAAGFSMRPDEASFTIDALAEAVEYAHSRGKKIYVGINMMMFQEDLEPLKQWLTATQSLEFDALIVADTGAFGLIRKLRPTLQIHISTQLGTANASGAVFWQGAGASRVVLARECTLEHAKEITEQSGMEIEMFVHGAMCVALSGRCLLSAHLCGESGSRGKCKHTCRWGWKLTEETRPGEALSVVETERGTIFLGSKDLCLIEHIPELVKSGICSLKVEGRMKSEYYVATVARVYRAALDCYAMDPDEYETKQEWIDELDAVSHRPYSKGFAFGYSAKSANFLQTKGDRLSTCDILGFVETMKDGVYTILVKNPFAVGEEVEWIAPANPNESGADMLGGKVLIGEINNEAGKSMPKSHCGTRVSVSLFDEGVLPEYAILRKRRA